MAPPGIAIPDLVDPMTYAEHDMAEVWRRLRTDDPVYRHPGTAEGPGFWVLSRYADIARVLRDDERFTSEKGNVLATMLRGGDTGAGRMLAVSDGPYRSGMSRHGAPVRIRHRIPLITGRRSRGGRPVGLTGGNTSSNTCHCV